MKKQKTRLIVEVSIAALYIGCLLTALFMRQPVMNIIRITNQVHGLEITMINNFTD